MSVLLIDRKLLERLQERLDPHRDAVDWGLVCDAFRTLPHPAPAEQVEVVAWQDAENPLYTTAERRVLNEWASNGYPIVELMTVAQHNRIMDATVPAGCKVVKVGLLERAALLLQDSIKPPDGCSDFDDWTKQGDAIAAELRAILEVKDE